MAGTPEGAKRARDKLLAKNPNYFRELGLKGAKVYREMPIEIRQPRGFAHPTADPVEMGRKGGSTPKKPRKKASE